MALAAAGVGAYFGYTEILKPYLHQRQIEAEARALAARGGISYNDALGKVGAAACKAAAASQGIPSNPLSSAACDLAGKIAAVGIIKGGKLAGKGIEHALSAIKHNPKTAAAAILLGPAAVPYLIASKLADQTKVTKAAKNAVVGLVKKIPHFWGLSADELEGLHC